MNQPLILAGFLLALTFGCKKEAEKVIPTVTIAAVSNITESSAMSGGEIISNGGAAIISCGVCWSTSHNPTISNSKTDEGSGIISFNSNLTGLSPLNTYYVRSYASNTIGTGYSGEVSFSTTEETIKDFDGNQYHQVTIGTQVWMVENLKVTHYRNGDPIPNITDDATWKTLTSGAYCNYNNDLNNVPTYGRLYNSYAVNDSRKIAPAGWHVPTENDYSVLRFYLGGGYIAGGPLKETGTSHWLSPNTGATNSSGFTALPGGTRKVSYGSQVNFSEMGNQGFWWLSSQNELMGVHFLTVNFILYGGAWQDGYSVRCIKD